MLYALRYFRVVAVVPPLFLAGFVFAALLAAIRLTSDPSSAVAALTPVLELQLFAAASGFEVPARRGYYDLLLTSGAARWQIAIAHGAASTLPGFVTWMCVGLLECAASHGARDASIAAGTCMAFVAWSLIAWAVAVFSSRTAATIVWMLVIAVPAFARVSPVVWLGVPASHIGVVPLAVMYAAAAAPFVVAMAWVIRGMTPLEASQ